MNPSQLTYSGIGPRSTPVHVLKIMSATAQSLSENGFLLRSGYAVGADKAFESGATLKHIFLPWAGYNGGQETKDGPLCITGVLKPSKHQLEIAALHYEHVNRVAIAAGNRPGWNQVKHSTQMLFARNVPIILGPTLDKPSDLVLTWHEGPAPTGGTSHALAIASSYGVPVFNLNSPYELVAARQFAYELHAKRLEMCS